MATKILDTDKVRELLLKYRPGLIVDKPSGGITTFRILCPFHRDTNPSFVYRPTTGYGTCESCKTNVTFSKLIASLENTTEDRIDAILESCKKTVKNDPTKVKVKTIDIAEAQLTVWNTVLYTDMKLLLAIRRWGWTDQVINGLMLGSSDGRLTIPMIEREDLIGLKYYSPGAKKMKYQNVDGSSTCCWPFANLEKEVIYLVEGEKDCITMISAGFNTVTFTGGAGGIPKNYIRYFAGKTVYIIYDIDEAGRKGAVEVAKVLNFATKSIYIVELPLEGIPKGDLTDMYVQSPLDFANRITYLCENTTRYEAPAAACRVTVPSDVFKTYLEDMVDRKLFYKRVNMKVRVVGRAYHETVIVPRDVTLTCNKDYKDHLCQQCPMFYATEGISLHVKPEYPELMSMVGNNNKIQRAAIQSMTEVIEGCPKFKVEQHVHQALYRVTLIPAIEADKKSHSYQMVDAWVLDTPSKDNLDYDIEGVILANPMTQKMELVVYIMKEDLTSIDSFELTEDMIRRLEVFQVCGLPPLTASQLN